MAKSKVQLPTNRRKRTPKYRSFRLSRKIPVEPYGKVPPTKVLWADTWKFVWKNKKKYLLFWLLYAVFYLVIVKGINGFKFDAVYLKLATDALLQGHLTQILTALGQYSLLVTSITATTNDVANYTQITLVVIFSLAFIRLLRTMHSKRHPATVKLAFYEGMRPLIPFVLVIVVMLAELLPAGLGLFILYTAQGASALTTQPEVLGIAVIAILFLALSMYLIAGAAFAPYIVTIKGMMPIMALKASMRLLRLHRWIIFRRIIMVLAIFFFIGFFLTIPILAWIPEYVEPVFFVIACGAFAVLHTYVFKLYRSLVSS